MNFYTSRGFAATERLLFFRKAVPVSSEKFQSRSPSFHRDGPERKSKKGLALYLSEALQNDKGPRRRYKKSLQIFDFIYI
jgi:hypothetical protein